MNWRRLFVAAAVVVALVGCTAGGIGLSRKKNPKVYVNVVSLSPSTTEYLAKLGGGAFLAGRTDSCDRPPQILTAPVVVESQRPQYEKIAAINPDLIIYDRSLYSDDEIAKLKKYGWETLEYDPTTIEDYSDFGYRLGSKLGIEMYTTAYLDKVYSAATVASSVPTTKPRVTLLLGDGKDGYYVMGKDGFHAHIMQSCGGTPVGADGKRFAAISIEKLIDLDPEIIYSDENAYDVFHDPRLQSVSAVKNRRVYDAVAKTIVRIGGDMEDVIKRFDNDFHRMPRITPVPVKP